MPGEKKIQELKGLVFKPKAKSNQKKIIRIRAEINEMGNQQRKNQYSQNLILWKINKFDKALGRLTKKKREKTQLLTSDMNFVYIERVIKEHYEQPCARKCHWKTQLPELTHEETDHLNRPITIKENEGINNNLPKWHQQTREARWWVLLNIWERNIANSQQVPLEIAEGMLIHSMRSNFPNAKSR